MASASLRRSADASTATVTVPGATVVEGNRFGGVAAGLAYAGAAMAA